MGFNILFAIFIGGGIGVVVGVSFLYLMADELRWHNFLLTVGGFLDNRATRWVFDTSLGKWINRKTVESYVRRDRCARASDIAVQEGLVDETVSYMASTGFLRDAAMLARRTGREDLAETLYRQLLKTHQAAGEDVFAAEVAEEAGFWDEAVEMLSRFQSRESRLRAARIAAAHEMPQTGIEIYLEEEAVMDAMRTAEEHGQVEFVLRYCEASGNPVLHQFAADAAKQIGDPERGLAVLLKHGNLHQASMFAKEAGLHEKAKELREQLREKAGRHPGLNKMDGI